MEFVRWLDGVFTRVWRALFRQGSLRLWGIILGAPPLCGIVIWIIDHLARLAVAADPVRVDLALAIADIGKMVTMIIGIIVVSLATVTVRATLPSGAGIAVGGSDGAAPAPEGRPEDRERERDRPAPSPWPPRRAGSRPPGQLADDERIEP